ncbi:glutathione S-transferase family protein [Erythrobacter sp. JK5]|uniref:glutathione S-transferase family protein n=1 Tax=Erythrobacter sp. JK5 TaxID=2829500 RepID=UPI001BA9C27C|nr:glutathione S-transferase family protein [Erythrobacter sp. JK5]QUL36878.1 glutathione S-transferase family protein [Erythrobacter sp. JK5]
MTLALTLISHDLCPYVQRALIALAEKQVEHERIYVDLANKPDWFAELSPLGKTPLLLVGQTAIFESAVILEYLEETQPRPLHPADPLKRAEHRSWIEFGSSILDDIARLYNARDETGFDAAIVTLSQKFARAEKRLVGAPWFDGNRFSLVDTVFGPVFRYFDTFDKIADFGFFANTPKVVEWRHALSGRDSVVAAALHDYDERLGVFLANRDSHISELMRRI